MTEIGPAGNRSLTTYTWYNKNGIVFLKEDVIFYLNQITHILIHKQVLHLMLYSTVHYYSCISICVNPYKKHISWDVFINEWVFERHLSCYPIKPCCWLVLTIPFHYSDVIMSTIASLITSLAVVYSTVYSDADQRKHQSSASLAFVWGIHRDRWIPRTKGQLRGKCFHLMTSSCVDLVQERNTIHHV